MLRSLVTREARTLSHGGGFGGFAHSEALPGALPLKQNSPQHPPYGLYPEMISGAAFTQPRVKNRYSWMYRIRPSVQHSPMHAHTYELWNHPTWVSPPFKPCAPVQFRFFPSSQPEGDVDFVDGTVTVAGCGSPVEQTGVSANTFMLNSCMSSRGRFVRNADADTLILPQEGELEIRTEMGSFRVGQCELALIPKGLLFQVNLVSGGSGRARGYYLENFGDQFVIPDLGPIGISSGLAHPRHFIAPEAQFEEIAGDFQLVSKFGGNLFQSELRYSPLDVVAWYGNHIPYKYDMNLFMAINTVTYDHPDPSINTVLSSYTASPGLANVDFVIFPPRWMVGEGTFRPPWFHRNFMSEFMGLLRGTYDAKPDSFLPGACSIHNRFTPHGPDGSAVKKGTEQDTSKAERYGGTLAFMWETRLPLFPSSHALEHLHDAAYPQCWSTVEKRFNASQKPPKVEPYGFSPN